MIQIDSEHEVFARLNAFSDTPSSLLPIYRSIAQSVANQRLEVDEVVSKIAMPILRHYLGEGRPITEAKAYCKKLEGLFDILIDSPYSGACLARFRQITAVLLEE